MKTNRGRRGGIAASIGIAMLLLLLATCESSLLTEIRAAARRPSAEISISIDGQRIEPDGDTDLGIWSISGVARHVDILVENVGDGILEITEDGIVLSGSEETFAIDGEASSQRLPPGGSHRLTITFDPDTVATSSAVVSVRSNDPERPVFSFTLRGSGANIAGLHSFTPNHNAIGVPKTTSVIVTFSKVLDHTTVYPGTGSNNVFLSPSVPFSYTLADSSERTTLTITPNSDLTPGIQYTLGINQNGQGDRILDTDGLEAQQATLVFDVLPIPAAPVGIPDPGPNTILNPLPWGSIWLEWPTFADATAYSVHFKAVDAVDWSRYPTSGTIEATSQEIRKLSVRDNPPAYRETSEYLWYVTAYNESGSLMYPGSTTPWVFQTGYYQPESPRLNLADGAANQGPNEVRLRWSTSMFAQSYTLFFRNAADSGAYTHVSDIVATEYTLPTTDSAAYYWYVRAIRGTNHSDASVRTFTTVETTPIPPSNVQLSFAETDAGFDMIVTWTGHSHIADGYQVSYHTAGTGSRPGFPTRSVQIATVDRDTTSVSESFATAPTGTWYRAFVRAFDANGSIQAVQTNYVRDTGGLEIPW